MFRTGLIVLIIALLVTDPFWCQSAAACARCIDSNVAAPCEHNPADAKDEACHDCICQGATMPRGQQDVVPRLQMGTVSQSELLPSVFVARDLMFLPPFTLQEPTSGRSVCIFHQSFLI